MIRLTVLLALLVTHSTVLAVDDCGSSVNSRSVVVVEPEVIPPAEGAIQNAGCGTEIWNGGPSDGEARLVKYAVRLSEYSLNSMIRPNWGDFESDEGVYRFEKLNALFDRCIQYRQKVNLAVFVTSSNHGLKIDGALCAYPRYVHEAMQKSDHKDVSFTSSLGKVTRWEPNFHNPYFFERYDALLAAFAEYLAAPHVFAGKSIERKKLVRCIEMRHFGWWGEGAYPRQFVPDNSECLIRFADSFLRRFPDIRLIAPTNGMVYVPSVYDTIKDYHFYLMNARNDVGLLGIFRDNWGWDERSSYFQRIYYAANRYEKDGQRLYELIRDRWKSAPLVGEPGRTYPKGDFRPYSCLMEQVEYLHPVVIRNCNVSTGGGVSPTNPTNYSIFNDPPALEQFRKAYAVLGFRYLFQDVQVLQQDDKTCISLNWQNTGLTPTYDRWIIRYFVLNEAGEEIWAGESSLDLRTVFPSESVAPGTIASEAGKVHTDRFDAIPAGRLFVIIEDPTGISFPMALSLRGRTEAGAYLLATLGK